jgi:heme-degrading monooxygenase HmoA
MTLEAATLINAFEVPVEADESFVTAWERARDDLASQGVAATSALHRALRADADFRFVTVARVDSRHAWRDAINDPAFPGRQMPFRAHPALYEVVHEDGAPEGRGGVTLINPFEVPAGDDERFVAQWRAARDVLAAQPGYLGTRLHRAVAPADFRFVNIARWSSPLAFAKALAEPDFQETSAAMPFTSHPALYEIVCR